MSHERAHSVGSDWFTMRNPGRHINAAPGGYGLGREPHPSSEKAPSWSLQNVHSTALLSLPAPPTPGTASVKVMGSESPPTSISPPVPVPRLSDVTPPTTVSSGAVAFPPSVALVVLPRPKRELKDVCLRTTSTPAARRGSPRPPSAPSALEGRVKALEDPATPTGRPKRRLPGPGLSRCDRTARLAVATSRGGSPGKAPRRKPPAMSPRDARTASWRERAASSLSGPPPAAAPPTRSVADVTESRPAARAEARDAPRDSPFSDIACAATALCADSIAMSWVAPSISSGARTTRPKLLACATSESAVVRDLLAAARSRRAIDSRLAAREEVSASVSRRRRRPLVAPSFRTSAAASTACETAAMSPFSAAPSAIATRLPASSDTSSSEGR
mmetsp:Transcript_66378/g.209924  ORF Transcript_66378/g.209924 Transcript_66378/m.209924 type:complete len:389 (+) Transcript_66378:3631-4797(+)